MDTDATAATIVLGVGAVIWNNSSEVLLIRRMNPPRQNEWSLPGGKVELGESLRAALVREVLEETGIAIGIVGLIDVAELILENTDGAPGKHYVLVDFCARALSGEVHAASDAAEARWFSAAELDALPLWSETRRIISKSGKLLNKSPTEHHGPARS
ncbi:MAG TPA: NUDIX hydrolase [Rhizomicrobium sp.]|jgi:8-oxo-dGTP diphosphatase|nr:NUDIX hydrolase [Rhizomicrobium sp.]